MKGYRTILLGIAVLVVGALQAVEVVDWIELLGDQAAGAVVSGLGLVMVVLRYLTDTPVLQAK